MIGIVNTVIVIVNTVIVIVISTHPPAYRVEVGSDACQVGRDGSLHIGRCTCVLDEFPRRDAAEKAELDQRQLPCDLLVVDDVEIRVAAGQQVIPLAARSMCECVSV